MHRILFLATILIVLQSCKITELEEVELTQKVYFEVEYINHAWGDAHYGKYIDGEGNVYSYHYQQNNDTWQPGDKREFTEEEIMMKFQPDKELVGSINLSVLRDKVGLIENAVQSSMSEILHAGADMGQVNYICYYLNENNLYEPILLMTEGDLEYYRTANAAVELANWLKGLNLHP